MLDAFHHRPARAVAILWLGVLLLTAGPAGAWTPPAQLDAALAAEDWPVIDRLLATIENSPGQVIRGHAALALNRNNLAVCHFNGLGDDDQRAWLVWVQAFAARHSDRAIAHYFRGDAFARLGRWGEARRAFDRALALRPTHALALNARAVVDVATGRWGEARDGFRDALASEPTLADAHANIGALLLHRRAGFRGAVRAYTAALQHSPDFALARVGLASAQVASGRARDAEPTLRALGAVDRCVAPLVAENLVATAAYMSGRRAGPQFADAEAGTTLDRRLDSVFANPSSQGAWNGLTNHLGRNPQDLGTAMQAIGGMAATNPDFAQRALGPVNRGIEWNAGAAQAFGSAMGGLQVGVEAGKDLFKAKATYDFGPLANYQNRVTENNLATFQDFHKTITGAAPTFQAPGGVTMDLSSAHEDLGDWPFVVRYGLLYPITAVAAAPAPTSGGVR